MTPEETNLEETRRLYAECAAGEWDTVREMLTDDFFVTEAAGLPYEGVYRGKDALKELYNKVMGMINVSGLDLVQMTTGGDWVIVLVEMKARDDQGEFRIPLAEGTRFRDGKVAEIRPYYFDSALVHRAADAKKAMA